MELFLNLCWLALLLPAYLLWARSDSSKHSARASLIFACTVGCALVLLFPVISASDDLHAIGQAMEESKPSLHQAGHCAGALHSVAHSSLAPPASADPKSAFGKAGSVLSFSPRALATFVASHRTGRAPPLRFPVSL
jgi:hypothetical protein